MSKMRKAKRTLLLIGLPTMGVAAILWGFAGVFTGKAKALSDEYGDAAEDIRSDPFRMIQVRKDFSQAPERAAQSVAEFETLWPSEILLASLSREWLEEVPRSRIEWLYAERELLKSRPTFRPYNSRYIEARKLSSTLESVSMVSATIGGVAVIAVITDSALLLTVRLVSAYARSIRSRTS
jgi:hypothetical protein